MKLKYKKMILAVTVSAMGIGLITYSIGTSVSNRSDKSPKITSESKIKDSKEDTDQVADTKSNSKSTKSSKTGTTASTELVENAYPEINTLVNKYLEASLKADMDTLKTVMTDTSVVDVKELQKKAEYIEGYKNISCYTKPGPVEGSYIVYVYSEVKILNIDTLAPGLTRLYICTAEDGKLYIFSSEYDDQTKDYIAQTEKDAKVIALIDNVNKKLAAAISSDADLKAFVDKLNQNTNKAKQIIKDNELKSNKDSSKGN
ncbi:hypothetical protein [Anaeromicropila herbilytica]|uniref:Uncharacterized protein n=1 Tax=Anaeromicropila herbilytica TaxID=2785025 RepID=A0A7R7EMU9_9FIRM|nr:hypothetical protein [Anaeromicropila herbilytica]BCN31693.1 hypothetical protein bsdtb5_29880 [Anaeromicropila herbilytica]